MKWMPQKELDCYPACPELRGQTLQGRLVVVGRGTNDQLVPKLASNLLPEAMRCLVVYRLSAQQTEIIQKLVMGQLLHAYQNAALLRHDP